MVFQYLDDICESVNLTTVYILSVSALERKIWNQFSRPMRPLETNQRNNVGLRMLVKIDSDEEGCHE